MSGDFSERGELHDFHGIRKLIRSSTFLGGGGCNGETPSPHQKEKKK